MSLTDAQAETVNGLDSKGLHLEPGDEPCECGPEQVVTYSERGYSDSMVYTHNCGECGRRFQTYTEG